MTGTEWAAVIGLQVCLVLLVVLVVALVRLDLAARDLRSTAQQFRAEAEPLLDELRGALVSAAWELQRIDAIVDGAARVTGRVDAASDLAERVITSPVVKVMAAGAGAKAAVARLKEPAPKRKPGRRAS